MSAPQLAVVDSSGWLEYFADTVNADFFAPIIEDPEPLVVPTLSILEVFKWVYRERGEDAALQVAALMQQGLVVDLDSSLAIRAAKLGLEHQRPHADSAILATAHAYGATLWTQDSDFQHLDGVQYKPAKAIGITTRRRTEGGRWFHSIVRPGSPPSPCTSPHPARSLFLASTKATTLSTHTRTGQS